jgi:hypothetical protein
MAARRYAFELPQPETMEKIKETYMNPAFSHGIVTPEILWWIS